MEEPSSSRPPSLADSEDEDSALAKSDYLTRQELLKRRARRLRRLVKYYRDYYWLLMESLKHKHREFYWMYGTSPYIQRGDGEVRQNGVVFDNDLHCNNGGGDELGLRTNNGGNLTFCSVSNCNTKAMALTSYCGDHILFDQQQVLYKGCIYAHKRSDEHGVGPILCKKPLLKSRTPSLCPKHCQDVRKQINQALKKGGVNVGLSSKLSSKFHFHLVIKEYVNLIQYRRRAIANKNVDIIDVDG